MQPSEKNALTTYAKTMLHSWPDVTALLKQIIRTSSPQAKQDTEKFVTQKTIQIAISSPYHHWINSLLAAYSQLADYSLQRSAHKEKVIKDSIQKHQIKTSIISKQPLTAGQLKKLSVSKLETMQKDLGTIIKQQYTDWKEFYQHWSSKIIEKLAACDITLDENECHDLKRYDQVSEVVAQINASQLTIDKELYNPRDFTDYLKLKSILALHNATLRQQQTSTIKLINKQMKHLKSLFSLLAKQEQQQIKQQQQQQQAVLSI